MTAFTHPTHLTFEESDNSSGIDLHLSSLLDVSDASAMVQAFQELTGISVGIADLEGVFKVSSQWQEVCSLYHRKQSDSLHSCRESVKILTEASSPAQVITHQCAHGLWDMATPIYAGDQQVGHLLVGQFFLDDVEIDWSFYRRNAQRFGYDEDAYLTALRRVPRISREAADQAMDFCSKLVSYMIQISVNQQKLKEAMALTRQMDSRYQTITSVSNVGAWEYHGGLKRDWYSPQYFTMLGYDPEEFGGNTEGLVSDRNPDAWMQLIHPEDRDRARTAFLEYVDSGTGDLYEQNFRLKRKDGNWAWIMSQGRTLMDPLGNPTHLTVGVHIDMTERNRIEENLKKEKLRAEEANRAKSQFLANMSHELRTPMNGLMGMIQLLQLTDLTEEQREYVENAMTSSHTMVGVMSDILDMAKLEAGQLILRITPFSLEKLVADTVSLFQTSASHKGILLRCHLDESLKQVYMGDIFRLRQVLTNLLGNAVKFTSSGYVEMRIRKIADLSSSTTNVVFEVEDTGIGISQTELLQIFQRFHQVDHNQSRAFGGTGLGLSICKGLAEMMEGRLWAESEPGKGSTFYFQCPLVPASEKTNQE